jgi:hypothetical protein
MCDPLLLNHAPATPPATYSRGSTRIDYILVSHALVPSVQRSGIMPFDAIFPSDHRLCYVDFHGIQLFQDETSNIAPFQFRQLKLYDPRIVDRYLEALHEQMEYHNLHEKIDRLHNQAKTGLPLTPGMQQQYETLDRIQTECMLFAEKQSSKIFSTKYDWSPKLKQAVKATQYRYLKIQQSRGSVIHINKLLSFQQEGGVPGDTSPVSLLAAMKGLQQAKQALREMQKRDSQLRVTHLEEQAEACITSKHGASLPHQKMLTAKKKEINRIIQIERIKRTHRNVRSSMIPLLNEGGLKTVEVPNIANKKGIGSKTWHGFWKTLSNPVEIAKQICAANAAQYHQANNTPFASEPLLSYFGHDANRPGAQ